MILSQSIFTFLIIIGIVGGVGGLTTLVSLLFFEKEHEYLKIDKKKTELESLLKEAQLSNLASQIHPHFFFNSLNAITSLIRLEKNKQAEEAIYAISSLLRYTIRDAQQLVSLKEEMSSVLMYLKIQKLRFGKRLEWAINIESDTNDFKIPMLLVQPLVENACKYGVEPRVEGGSITIVSRKDPDGLTIEVTDNGNGMDKETVDEFEMWKHEGGRTHNLGIGIKNTFQRLNHYFGSDGNFKIISSPSGTTCIIMIKEVKDESIIS
jgi:sensor histidine kinase YesM